MNSTRNMLQIVSKNNQVVRLVAFGWYGNTLTTRSYVAHDESEIIVPVNCDEVDLSALPSTKAQQWV